MSQERSSYLESNQNPLDLLKTNLITNSLSLRCKGLHVFVVPDEYFEAKFRAPVDQDSQNQLLKASPLNENDFAFQLSSSQAGIQINENRYLYEMPINIHLRNMTTSMSLVDFNGAGFLSTNSEHYLVKNRVTSAKEEWTKYLTGIESKLNFRLNESLAVEIAVVQLLKLKKDISGFILGHEHTIGDPTVESHYKLSAKRLIQQYVGDLGKIDEMLDMSKSGKLIARFGITTRGYRSFSVRFKISTLL
jgi:hypothetical protein